MSYTFQWHPKAAKYVEHLPKGTARRILEKLDEVVLDPFRYVERFEG